jgi:hypothetical protein
MNDTINDISPRPALVAASWFSLFVAVLAMSVPYMQFISGVRTVEMITEEFDAELPTWTAVFGLPQWTAAGVLAVLMLALVIKELAASDAVVKIAVNLSVAVVLIVAGVWLGMLAQAAQSHTTDQLAPLEIGTY